MNRLFGFLLFMRRASVCNYNRINFFLQINLFCFFHILTSSSLLSLRSKSRSFQKYTFFLCVFTRLVCFSILELCRPFILCGQCNRIKSIEKKHKQMYTVYTTIYNKIFFLHCSNFE